jgi:hypothetical protein
MGEFITPDFLEDVMTIHMQPIEFQKKPHANVARESRSPEIHSDKSNGNGAAEFYDGASLNIKKKICNPKNQEKKPCNR